MFPTTRVNVNDVGSQPNNNTAEENDKTALLTKLHEVLKKLTTRKVVPGEISITQNISRPGSMYQRYRSENQLPPKPKAFYETAAQVAGVSLKTMVMVVWQTEYRLDTSKEIRENQKRREEKTKHSEDSSSDDDSSDGDVMDTQSE